MTGCWTQTLKAVSGRLLLLQLQAAGAGGWWAQTGLLWLLGGSQVQWRCTRRCGDALGAPPSATRNLRTTPA